MSKVTIGRGVIEDSNIYVSVKKPHSLVTKNYPFDNSSIPEMVKDVICLMGSVPDDSEITFARGIFNEHYIDEEKETSIRAAFKERRSKS